MPANYALRHYSRYPLDHPDDRLRATLVILDAALAGSWTPLLTRGQHLGVAGLVTGEWPGARRILRLDGEGLLHIEAPGLDGVTLAPCLLPPEAMKELATVVVDEPDEPDEQKASTPAAPMA